MNFAWMKACLVALSLAAVCTLIFVPTSLSVEMSDGSSVSAGIIGGADGPTAIFIAPSDQSMYSISRYEYGQCMETVPLNDAESEEMVYDLFMQSMLRSAAWPALSTESMEKSLQLCFPFAGERQVVSVFRYLEHDCLQSGSMYTYLPDGSYESLLALLEDVQ